MSPAPGSPPVRSDVPGARLRVSAVASVQLVIGHIGVLVGWFLLLVVSFFFWGFVMQSDLVTASVFDAELARTSSLVARVEPDGRRGPDVHVDFTYEVGGQRFTGRSYAANERAVPEDPMVEYVVGDPSLARIVGLDAHPIRGGSFFLTGVVAVSALTLILLGAGARAGLRSRRFFTRARPADGRVVATHQSSADSRVVSIELEYADAGRANNEPSPPWRTQVVVSRGNAPGVGAELPMLYDPEDPARAMLLDRLECGVRARRTRIVAGMGWLVAGLLAPLVLVVTNVVAALTWTP